MKKFVAGLTISFVLAMGAMVYAQGHGMMGQGSEMGHGFMGRGMGMMGGEQHLLKKLMSLGLDEQQKGTIKTIVRTTQKETIKKRADLAIARLELKDLLDKDPVDMTAVEAKLKQIASLKTDMQLSHIKTLEAVKAKLTPDQKKKFEEMKEQGMMGRRGMMMRKGCGMMNGMKGMMKGGMMGGMKGGMMQPEQMETGPQSSGSDEDLPEMEQD